MSAPETADTPGEESAPEVAPWRSSAAVSVNVHVRSGTALGATVHADEGRVVLGIEGANSALVQVFVRRADLARLIATATGALAELDTTRETEDSAAFHRVLDSLS